MLHMLFDLILIILLRQNLKGMQLSIKQWQYKLLQKLDHWLLKQLPGLGLLMAEDPPLLLASPHWVQELKV